MSNLVRLRELMDSHNKAKHAYYNGDNLVSSIYVRGTENSLCEAAIKILPALIAVAEAAGNLHPNHSTGELDKALAELEGVRL